MGTLRCPRSAARSLKLSRTLDVQAAESEKQEGEIRPHYHHPRGEGKGQGGLPTGLSVTGDVSKLFPFASRTAPGIEGEQLERASSLRDL